MENFTIDHLPQATRALQFITAQLLDLSKNCTMALENNQVHPAKFMEVEKQLEKLLHETRAACSPPPATPAMTDFDVVKPLASGSFGAVSLVRHRKSRQEFALKEIKLQYPEQKDEVLLERDILAHLDNPHVVSLFCSFQTEDHMCMIMEYVGGGDVATLLRSCERFSVDTARFYIAELVSALRYIHSCGIIHQDLKPDNLMVTNEGHIKVTDFGLAMFGSVNIRCLTEDDCQRVAEEFTDGECWGTPHYIAPEMYLGTGYGKPVDWWATGIILYEFLYGVTPFGHAPAEYVEIHVIKDEVLWPDEGYSLPPDVLSLMQQLLDKNPITRLGTRGASEVKGHLFFQDVDWDTLHTQTPPQIPPAKVEKAPQGRASQTFDASPEDDGWEEAPAKVADFCYVAFRFREEYGSAPPLSSLTPHEDYSEVEEEQKMSFDGGSDGGCDDPVDDRFDEDNHEDFEEDLHEDDDDGYHEDFVEVDSSSLHQTSEVSVDHSVVECQSSDVLAASTWGNHEMQLVDLDEDDGSTPPNGPMTHHDILHESCNTWNITIHDSSEDHVVVTVEDGSSPDATTVTVEEDCGEENHEPEALVCQSADVLEAATTPGFAEFSSRSHWPRTAAARCRKAWRASKAFWRRVFKRRTPLQSERTHRKKAEEMV